MSPKPGRGYGVYEFINRWPWSIAAALIVIAVILAAMFPLIADDSEPNFSPGGEIYDTQDMVDQVFSSSSPIREATFIIENPNGGDVLTRDSLLELSRNQAALMSDAESRQHLASAYSTDLGITIDGTFSIADAVDAALPGGLEAASNAEVKMALSGLLADGAPTAGLRFLLSTTQTTREPATVDGQDIIVWESPAFFARVLWDIDTFEGEMVEAFEDDTNLNAERWLRDVQATLRGDQANVTALGLGIDIGLVGEELNATSGPFIFAAVAFILIFVGALLRSYWAAMLVGAGLGVVMMGYNGINALIGLKTGSPLLIMVVPIALISFGVDFFVHGSGRAREMQVRGETSERAYPLGMTKVFAALLLAALTSAAAFLSNAVSGVQAITEFGIAAATALLLSYVVLGWVAPKILLVVEEGLGPRPSHPSHLRTIGHKFGFFVAAFIAGAAVTMTIVFPAIGWAIYLVFLLLFLAIPYRITKRRNTRAAAAGVPTTDEVKGSGHGFKAAGSVVHFLARWRVFTVPAATVLAIIGVIGAFQVQSGFEIKDFFPSNTDFVTSLDKVDEFFVQAGSQDYIYLEGDLTDPDTVLAMEEAAALLDQSDAAFARDFNGDIELSTNAATVVRLVTASGPARAAVEAQTGVAITDADGNGLADTPEQVAAIYSFAKRNPLVNDRGVEIFAPARTETFLFVGDQVQATRVGVSITSWTDDALVLDARQELNDVAAGLRTSIGDQVGVISVSGAAITNQDTLASFTDAMLLSLPVALVLTVLIVLGALLILFHSFGRRPASVVKRSLRYALISIVPILLVVAWVYGFMYAVGYKINVITATIAAIAIGVGIDYSTHFTVRFIEEFEGEPSRFPALRRAGEGTGGALAISALTSMTGFVVMAFAPMPMFRTFGVLTAVMIAFAVLVSLLVLPSLLMLITPSRKGAERDRLIDRVTGGEFDYEPHARETALRQPVPR